MKKKLRYLASAGAVVIAALAISSCAYDPYYGGGSSVSASYNTGSGGGYGDGYGYGSRGFSTSVFVSTGDPRWGYDPNRYSYYDYSRRSYYDPYLNGYYPLGYLPPIVYGVPHPYGWRPGGGYCPPPRRVNNYTVSNYRDRAGAYRNSSYGWARQVRQQDRQEDQRPSRNEATRQNSDLRSGVRQSRNESTRENQQRFSDRSERNDNRDVRSNGRPSAQGQENSRLESRRESNQGARQDARRDVRQDLRRDANRAEPRANDGARRVAPGRSISENAPGREVSRNTPGHLRQAQNPDRGNRQQADRNPERRGGPQANPPGEGRRNNGKPKTKEEEQRAQDFR